MSFIVISITNNYTDFVDNLTKISIFASKILVMYKGFEIKGVNTSSFGRLFDEYKGKGEDLMEQLSLRIISDIESIVLKDSILDGNMIMNKWFKRVDADVFISHSHDDLPLALALSGYLYDKLNIKCFVDSLIWGKADKLLESIDKKYSRNIPDNGNYNYYKRNYSTSHVHNMLLMSITHMIDETDCLFFLNTPNSMPLEDGIKKQTLSPWIYSEIEISRVIRKKLKKAREIKHFSASDTKILEPVFESQSLEQLHVGYELNTDHLLSIPISYIKTIISFNDLTSQDHYTFLRFLYNKHKNYIE